MCTTVSKLVTGKKEKGDLQLYCIVVVQYSSVVVALRSEFAELAQCIFIINLRDIFALGHF